MSKLPAIIALMAGLMSCVGVDQNLGGDFIPTDQKYDFHTAEFDLDEVWMKSIDSLTAYSSRRITIGSIRDETFGLFSRGSMVTLVNHPKKTKLPSMNEAVKQIEQEVLTTWPTEAISHAENVVYRLSGMYEFVVNDAPEQTEDAGPAEPVSAGKCSTVS